MKINPQLKEDLKKHLSQEISKKKQKVSIVSVYGLSKDEIVKIQETIPGIKNREVENVVDPGILGGVIVQFGSKIIDLSLKSKLYSFQKKIYETHR